MLATANLQLHRINIKIVVLLIYKLKSVKKFIIFNSFDADDKIFSYYYKLMLKMLN